VTRTVGRIVTTRVTVDVSNREEETTIATKAVRLIEKIDGEVKVEILGTIIAAATTKVENHTRNVMIHGTGILQNRISAQRMILGRQKRTTTGLKIVVVATETSNRLIVGAIIVAGAIEISNQMIVGVIIVAVATAIQNQVSEKNAISVVPTAGKMIAVLVAGKTIAVPVVAGKTTVVPVGVGVLQSKL
jgi:hypothetical protein